jgi:hypothetical protein
MTSPAPQNWRIITHLPRAANCELGTLPSESASESECYVNSGHDDLTPSQVDRFGLFRNAVSRWGLPPCRPGTYRDARQGLNPHRNVQSGTPPTRQHLREIAFGNP